MYKYLRPVKIKRIVKSSQPMKIKRIVKSLRPMKIRRMVKSLQLLKIKWMVKSLRPEKIRQMMESLRSLKSPRLMKNECLQKSWRDWKSRRNWKSRQPAYSPTADFSLVPLMSTFSSSLIWWISHVVSKWGGSTCHPAFMGELSRTVPTVCTGPPCQEMAQIHAATKSWLLPGIPLISVKSK